MYYVFTCTDELKGFENFIRFLTNHKNSGYIFKRKLTVGTQEPKLHFAQMKLNFRLLSLRHTR